MITLWLLLAFANEPPPPTAESRVAEYQRLANEIVGQAQRGHWVAVDRLLESIRATGQPYTPQVLVVFAQAASRHGDIAQAKDHLEHALSVQPDEEITAWVARIERVYSPVFFASDLPANYRLTPTRMPFQLEERSAVEFAQQAILDSSKFRGLLPRGTYRFAPYGKTEGPGVYDIEVLGGRRSIDIRTHDEPTARDRRKRAKINKKLNRRR